MTKIKSIEEPWIQASIIVPDEYLGAVLALCTERRGEQVDLTYVGGRALTIYHLPLNEVVFDFYDRLKTVTRGFASMDYRFIGQYAAPLVKLEILLSGTPVDALGFIIHRDKAYERGRALVEQLRNLIPRQLFEVAIQASIGSRVIARESVRALRKDVLAKCYGGDVTRKRKLLQKQAEGKKRLKRIGQVEVPQEAFLALLKISSK